MQDVHPDVVILNMEKVINTTRLDMQQTLHANLEKRGADLILCDLNAQPASIVQRSGSEERLGIRNLAANITDTLLRVQRSGGHEPEVSYV